MKSYRKVKKKQREQFIQKINELERMIKQERGDISRRNLEATKNNYIHKVIEIDQELEDIKPEWG